MRVLIAGGAGFIGPNIRENLAGLDVDLLERSILDCGALTRGATGIDTIVRQGVIPSVPRSIVQLASQQPNTTGTRNVLEAGVGHVIVASSSSVYRSNPKHPKGAFDWTRTMSPSVSKQATEGDALAYQFSYGLKAVAFRFFSDYGPGRAAGHAYVAVIPKLRDAALHGLPLGIHGDSTQSRDFTFVDTVCAVIHDALPRRGFSPDPVNLDYGTNTNSLELIAPNRGTVGAPRGGRLCRAKGGRRSRLLGGEQQGAGVVPGRGTREPRVGPRGDDRVVHERTAGKMAIVVSKCHSWPQEQPKTRPPSGRVDMRLSQRWPGFILSPLPSWIGTEIA